MTEEYTVDMAHGGIDEIFKVLLPNEGLAERPEQIKLSHLMLDAILTHRIALCDAGTGIGKTYAYLVAGIMYHKYRQHNDYRWLPVVVSTSSIALQNAVLFEYLPFLSKVLMNAGIIDKPVCGALRKGKTHYVCAERLEQRLTQLTSASLSRQRTMEHLKDSIDLDTASGLTSFDRASICVPAVCDCGRSNCSYRAYLREMSRRHYCFQVCNHNLLLADAIHRDAGMRPVLPDNCCIILDESHRLGEAARQMFGLALTADDLKEVLDGLGREGHLPLSHFLRHALRRLLPMLEQPPTGRDMAEYVQELVLPYLLLHEFQKEQAKTVSPVLLARIRSVFTAACALLTCDQNTNIICYSEASEDGGTTLWAMPYHLEQEMKRVLWRQFKGIVLTSGTMAVKQDFSRFRAEVGLTDSKRTVESVSPSPFAYRQNCLLYLPRKPPALVYEETENPVRYYDALTKQIAELLDAAYGHALVLFTSYAMMEAVEQRLRGQNLFYPIYVMRKHQVKSLTEFRRHPGAVMLATGSVWEGMDFPGDQVSLLIIPKLPFAVRNALTERRRQEYETLAAFIQDIIVPEMQIKLRQGFGRAIRTETDTCAVAVLDERCAPGQRYHRALLEALPEMPVTSDLSDVAEFYLDHKPTRYFKEVGREYES